MSIVTEALASSGSLAKDDLSTKISKLSNNAFEVKQELFDFTEQCFVDFYPLLSSTEHIHAKLSTLKNEVENLQLSLDSVVKNQIKDSTKEYEQLSKEHSKTLQLVSALEKLHKVHNCLKDHDSNISDKNLLSAATSLFEIESLLNNVKDSAILDSKIFKAIRTEFVCKRENLVYTLGEVWRDCVSSSQGEEEAVKLTLKFQEESNSVEPQDLIYAINTCGILDSKMKKISEIVMEHFIKPCITNNTFLPFVGDSKKAVLSSKFDESLTDKKLCPEEVFDRLKIVLGFLYDNLFKYQLSSSKGNDATLMSLFRSIVAEELINVLVEQCLMKSVPESKEGLEQYSKIEKQVKEFERMLQQIGFLDQDSSSSLIDFVSNIHTHFANHRCTSVLAKARNLMKKDLYETVQIEPTGFGEVPQDILEKLRSKQASEKHELVKRAMSHVLKPSKPMDDNTLQLPRFRVSRGAKELVDLAYETLHEATSSTAECVLRLISTTQNIFEIYAAVVPVHHREALTNLPQVSALHYNDCWFIAHHLLTMGHQFSEHLPTKHIGVPLTFVHQVPMIRQLGCECFLAQMRRQRKILLESLAPLKEFSTFPSKNKFLIAEKPVKQVSHALHHLRSLWSEVLPTNISLTSLATLADCAITETVNAICTLEDISSDDSVQYRNICCLLRDETSSLFSNEGTDFSWQRKLKKWQRLSELILVLDLSLRGVVDRWSDGKGPLASAFTMVEVKGLIRALFQNTDQRANAISKIRY